MGASEEECRWEMARAYLRWKVRYGPRPLNFLAYLRAIGLSVGHGADNATDRRAALEPVEVCVQARRSWNMSDLGMSRMSRRVCPGTAMRSGLRVQAHDLEHRSQSASRRAALELGCICVFRRQALEQSVQGMCSGRGAATTGKTPLATSGGRSPWNRTKTASRG